jgi:hypothetical protein
MERRMSRTSSNRDTQAMCRCLRSGRTSGSAIHREGLPAYGHADPTNVPPVVHDAEMRVAETHAVRPALRKDYGIGIWD